MDGSSILSSNLNFLTKISVDQDACRSGPICADSEKASARGLPDLKEGGMNAADTGREEE